MKIVIQDLNELTDSKELLESKPHPFTTIFIYLLFAITFTGFIWSYFGEIDIVVKANGIVRPNSKISTINNSVQGKVETVYFEEGQKVKQGDRLYTIEHSDLIVMKDFYENEFNKKKVELENLKKFKKSVLEKKNYFDKQKIHEKSFYDKYLEYEVNQIKEIENANLIIEKLYMEKDKINNLEKLVASVDENINLFENEENEYCIQYLEYQLNIKKLESIKNEKKRDFDIQKKLYESSVVARVEYENSKTIFEKSEIDFEKYETEMKFKIRSEIKETRNKLKELEINLKQTVPEKSKDIAAYSSIAENQFKTSTLIQIDEKIKQVEIETNQLKNNLDTTNLKIKECIVKAPIDGYVNIIMDINKGDNIQLATKIITIIPDNNENYKVQIYASNEDIANIKIGDKVKYNFPAFPYREYGELIGRITKIAKDINNSQDNQNSFYLVETDIENKPLISYKGEKAKIKVGMTCEARVITNTKKIIYYLLEKIDLRI